ncbi:hypothetical protein [Pseudomonas sp.]|uniref:hypothetical protein n=2 Tax=Pseudomonas TaxID=286 RepID=UPI002897187B|nr:hypothetical protein [Pseudomonas sp.]
MSIADIDALVGGLWSSDVFEVTEGRSHWDYASERLSTRPVSLDASPYGELRVTEWAAAAPAFIFGAGSTIYGSTSVELAQLDNLTNVVVIEGGYRFPRLWQENNTYSWTSPQMGGHTMIGPGFCEWRTNSTELPTKAMVSEALTGSGQTLIGADWLPLPDSHPDPCDTGAPWINTFYPELLLGFTVNAARRWTQQVTEQYSIRIEATASVAQAGEQITRERLALQIENDQAEAWESDPITEAKPGGAHDLVDEVRREAAINVLMNKARTTILGAHRDTKVRIEVPAPMVVDVDLIHTLRVDDAGIKAVGKCSHIEDTFDMTSGEAVTQITLSVQRGGDSIAVNDPLVMPPLTPLVDPPTGNTYAGLSTQLSGRSSDPPFDEDLDGFSGSFDSYDPGTPERYPRRVKVTAPEIDEARRNEHVNEVPALIRISIPNDTLEL